MRVREIEDFCDNFSSSPKKRGKYLVRKPLKRILKTCDKDAEVWLFTVDSF